MLRRLHPRLPDGLSDDRWIATDAANLIKHEAFDLVGGERLARTVVPTSFGRVQAGVVAIPFVFLGAVARRHRALARFTKQYALENRTKFITNQGATIDPVSLENPLSPSPDIATDNLLMLSLMYLRFVFQFAELHDVSQDAVE